MDKKRKVVYCTGSFDIFHPGHIAFIKKARAFGDFLVIGLNTDEYIRSYKGQPINTYKEREAILEAIRYVDAVWPRDGLEDMGVYKKYGPGVRVIGSEKGKYDFNSKYHKMITKYGIEIKIIPRSKDDTDEISPTRYSSTKIKKRVCDRYLTKFIWQERSNGQSRLSLADKLGCSQEKIRQIERRALIRKIIENGKNI